MLPAQQRLKRRIFKESRLIELFVRLLSHCWLAVAS